MSEIWQLSANELARRFCTSAAEFGRGGGCAPCSHRCCQSGAERRGAGPLFADLAGLPPILVQSTSDEILREDSRRLVQALGAARVPVSHREFPRMWHDFQLYAGIVPEATLALAEIARFVAQHLTVNTGEHAASGVAGALKAGAVQSRG